MLVASVLAMGSVVAVVATGVVPAAAASPVAPSTATLPAPYRNWNVTLTATDHEPQVLDLSFTSPILGQRITNTVFLPTIYRPDGPPLPVLYALHGTVLPALDNCALNPVTDVEPMLRMIGCGGGYLQTELYGIDRQLDAMKFIAVAPDTDPTKSVCEVCIWTDSADGYLPPLAGGQRLNADSFLTKELYPLVETLFRTRTDRSGRGVIGFSMGGWAASLQAMMHPDTYSYVSATSQVYNALDATTLLFELGFQYQINQGYDDPVTGRVMWQQTNPADLDTNMRGAGITYFISAGDGCTSLEDLLTPTPECQGQWSLVRNTVGSSAESSAIDASFRFAKKDLPQDGVPFQAVMTPGTHGANNARMFADYIVPQANATFAATAPTPTQFGYRSAWPQFSVWGYDVSVDRAHAGFLTMSNARTDGTSVTVAGSGVVQIRTPGRFAPGAAYTVTTTESGTSTTSTATADGHGRLALTADLGRGADRSATIRVA